MASRGKTTQLDHMYVADFETCDAYIPKEGEIADQRVWLAGYKNLETLQTVMFDNLDDFMNDILARKDNMNTEYTFHNLKFDGSYIVPWLFSNGYKVTHDKPSPKEFSILVDDRNAWYSITVQVTKRRRVLIWDSHKLFPAALEYLPDIYSTPTHKLREDNDFYNKLRPVGYTADDHERAYLENDLQVPAETLRRHIELYGLRFKKTQASQSFYNFEQMFPGWKWRFPALTLEQDRDIRKAYWGGISHVPKHKSGKDYYNIAVYDINSSYPDKAANFKLPYGLCVAEYGEGKHPDMSKFWVAEALVKFELLPDCLPSIPSKAITEGKPLEYDKWMDNSEGVVKMKFSNIDYYTMQESYKIKIVRWCWSMHWAWKVQKEIAKFVYKNNDNKVKYSKLAKLEKDKQKKIEYKTIANRAKIDNNGFYGKFGEEVIKKGKTPYPDEEKGGITWEVDREDEQSERSRKYLPVAIAITAWGRHQLVKMWNILGKYALYCDTDSIHYLREGEHLVLAAKEQGLFEVDSTKLGAWKLEGLMTRGRYLRSKCYLEETEEGELEATVAGLPADKHSGIFSKKRSCLNWENFYIGHTVPIEEANRLRTVPTKTGNKLVPVKFKITEKISLFG